MFKTIKFIADLVKQNNEYQRGVADILLKLHKPETSFMKPDIVEIDFALCEIEKLQKENTELKQELDLVYDDMTALVEKCQYTQYREGEQPIIQDDQMRIIFEHIDKLHKDVTALINERDKGVIIKR